MSSASAAAAASEGMTGDRKKEIIGLFLGIAFLLYTLFTAPPEGISVSAWKTIGVTLLMATWWMLEAIPISVTALAPLVLFPVLGVLPAKQVAPNYANDLIWLFVGGFALAYAMETWNLHRRVSLIVLKVCGTNPKMLILGFMIATGFLSAWMSNTACAALMMPIGMAIVKMVQEGENRSEIEKRAAINFGICVMLGIAFSSSMGGMATLIGTPPNAVMAGQVMQMTGTAVPFANFMLVGGPIGIALIAITLFLLPAMFPIKALDLSAAGAIVDEELEKLGPMSTGERLTMILFVVTALSWILRPQLLSLLPAVEFGGKVTPLSKFITDSTIGMTALLLCFLVPVNFKKGRMLLDSSLFAKGIPWDAILLFGGGFALGGALSKSGVTEYVAQQMQGLAGMSPLVIMAILATVAMLLTQMTSNTAVAATFVPLSISIAQGLGVSPLLMAIPVALGASLAFALPVATPPNAIVFGSGLIRVPDMFKSGFTLCLIGIVISIAVMAVMMPIAFGVKV
ncbi:Anion transporter [uncultured Alphaproteobacteria bacterium]|uniref:Anion transporter n=1 Tax=uncultured Alphaproteobacteria bacterium TaxID=91750 RepID=A0A212KMQ5_9PROT|nr:Anion transporter [uncultured Alphaproteobacteria bacterium]